MDTNDTTTKTQSSEPERLPMDVANALNEMRILAELICEKIEGQWTEDYKKMPPSVLVEYRNHDANQISYLAGNLCGVLSNLEAMQ